MADRSLGRLVTRRRGYVLAALVAACATAGASLASERGDDRSQRATAALLRAPVLLTPAHSASAQAVPGFSWRRVRGAAKYEFQFSADARFRSTLASFDTANTSATVDDTVFDGNYYWRVRAVNARRAAGRWSPVRMVQKRWAERPGLLSPAQDATIAYPNDPLVLRWSAARHAVKYEVVISADPTLAGNVVGNAGKPFETSGTNLAVPGALSPGRYYWAVTPMDAGGLEGPRSVMGSFVWSWPSTTIARVVDLWGGDNSIVDPQFQWDPIPGAARYEIEVNSSQDFAPGSKVCCADPTTGTSLSPLTPFPNNNYYWRVRARDLDGNAGAWNPENPTDFAKFFVPGAPNLRVRDNVSNSLPAGSTTSSPVIAWDPVPGASSYEIQVVPQPVVGLCNWSEPATSTERWDVQTSSTAWAPLGFLLTSPIDPAKSFERDFNKALVDGKSYCARVRSRGATDTSNQRVVGDWTEVADINGRAFVYDAPTIGSAPGAITTPAANYLAPAHASNTPRMPLFTWTPVEGACQYVVGVWADENLTKLVDQAVTRQPTYAPRLRTYPDETTTYYWAVLPVKVRPVAGNPCDFVTSFPEANSPREFQKRSVAPVQVAPAAGTDVTGQPTFRWAGATGAAVEAARDYRIQVATDPSFGNPIDDVKTGATAFTSSSTYPADTELFWRLRANDENGLGLAWSPTGTFRRRLPIPQPSDSNPTRGETFPVFSWSSVPGAISYDFHVEEEDGDKRDWTFRTTAASFTTLYGLGTFRWQVRANFPRLPFGTVQSGWSPVKTFTRFIDPPAGVGLRSDRTRILLSWDPSVAAKRYRVDFSETNSFNQLIHSHMTSNPNYAPRMTEPGFANGGLLHWRVAALDEGNNVGGFAIGSVRLPRGMRVTALGALSKRRRGLVTVIVTNMNGQPLRRATVLSRGAGSRRIRRRTGRRGMVRVGIRPRRRGNVTFTVRKRGYRAGKATVRVG